MAYILYSLTFFSLVLATVLFATRNLWKPYAPPIPYLTAPGPIPDWAYYAADSVQRSLDRIRYSRLPNTFAGEAEAGLHSSNFNLAENIEAGDSRTGLDENVKREVYAIMKRRNVTFDEARRIHVEERFGREGISADGRPLDRKAVMFS
ncbi:hypothetical protein MRB53_038827 [Persea americana]|nr:hypothetical protein MRB53_038827 [Persea americana]